MQMESSVQDKQVIVRYSYLGSKGISETGGKVTGSQANS